MSDISKLPNDVLIDRVMGLYAYSQGAIDSGIRDEEFRRHFRDLENERLEPVLKACIAQLLQKPYMLEDIARFVTWMQGYSGLDIDWL